MGGVRVVRVLWVVTEGGGSGKRGGCRRRVLVHVQVLGMLALLVRERWAQSVGQHRRHGWCVKWPPKQLPLLSHAFTAWERWLTCAPRCAALRTRAALLKAEEEAIEAMCFVVPCFHNVLCCAAGPRC